MRTFIAIDLPDSLKAEIANFINHIKPSLNSKINYVSKENLHLTLKFLGEIDENDLSYIEEGLKKIEHNKFSINLNGLGCFPSSVNPRVLWIGIKDEGKNILSLYEKVNSVLPVRFIEDDKPFSPHLTIARIKEKPMGNFLNLIHQNKDKDFGSFNVLSFYLYESKLERSGAKYNKIRAFSLK